MGKSTNVYHTIFSASSKHLWCMLLISIILVFSNIVVQNGTFLQSTNRKENIVGNNFLKQLTDEYLKGYMHYKENDKLLGYANWMKGLGNTSLSNNNMTSCIFKHVPTGSTLALSQAFNEYPLFEQDHKCNSKANIFSFESNRIITIKCMKTYVVGYYESNHIFNSNRIKKLTFIAINKNIKNKILIDKYSASVDGYNIYYLTLHKLTQNTFIKCGEKYNFHLTLLPLKQSNNELYRKQRDRYFKHFGHDMSDEKPPNVVIFVIDSTSRSNFMRSTPMTVDYLNALMSNDDHSNSKSRSPSYVYQFFRHSTVGARTRENMNALVRGICRFCADNDKRFDNYSMDLHQYFTEFGYNAFGYHQYNELLNSNNFSFDSQRALDLNDENNNGVFILSEDVFSWHFCCHYAHKTESELFTDLILNAINKQQKIDKIPYFMIVHLNSNHVSNGQGIWAMDKYIRNMVEYLDLDNTILHITADHGCLLGECRTNIYGQMEATNPVSILLLPKSKFENKYRKEILHKLKINQQRLITHYDLHLFWKQIPLLFTTKYGHYNNINNIDWIYNTLPHSMLYETRPAQSIMTQYISPNRSCSDPNHSGIVSGHCFCDIFNSVQSTAKQIELDKKCIKYGIEMINNLTGNGKYDCMQLNANDFEVLLRIKGEQKLLVLTIQHKKEYYDNMDEYKLVKLENRLLTFVITYHIKKIKKLVEITFIERVDYFKYEECLTTRYDINEFEFGETFLNKKDVGTDLEPIFKNTTNQHKLMNGNTFNLRLCRCFII